MKTIAIRHSQFWHDNITVQIIEDEIVVECNHAGHYPDTIVTYDDGLDNDYTEKVEVCDKCDAWSYDGEEWHE